MTQLGHYGQITAIESQTYEDPMILAMNLFDDPAENQAFWPKHRVRRGRHRKLYDKLPAPGGLQRLHWNDILNQM
jgi:serine protein kinase